MQLLIFIKLNLHYMIVGHCIRCQCQLFTIAIENEKLLRGLSLCEISPVLFELLIKTNDFSTTTKNCVFFFYFTTIFRNLAQFCVNKKNEVTESHRKYNFLL